MHIIVEGGQSEFMGNVPADHILPGGEPFHFLVAEAIAQAEFQPDGRMEFLRSPQARADMDALVSIVSDKFSPGTRPNLALLPFHIAGDKTAEKPVQAVVAGFLLDLIDHFHYAFLPRGQRYGTKFFPGSILRDGTHIHLIPGAPDLLWNGIFRIFPIDNMPVAEERYELGRVTRRDGKVGEKPLFGGIILPGRGPGISCIQVQMPYPVDLGLRGQGDVDRTQAEV